MKSSSVFCTKHVYMVFGIKFMHTWRRMICAHNRVYAHAIVINHGECGRSGFLSFVTVFTTMFFPMIFRKG